MHGQKNTREKGQSMVEFAMALPILILILSGLIDIGRAYFAYIYLEEAAAEAVKYLALFPECVTDDLCADPNNAEWRARNSGSTQGILLRSDIDVCQLVLDTSTLTPVDDEICAVTPQLLYLSDTVKIRVTVPFSFITPGISAIARGVSGSSVITFTVIANHQIISD
jgi:Flp pilus assembly protein TadG